MVEYEIESVIKDVHGKYFEVILRYNKRVVDNKDVYTRTSLVLDSTEMTVNKIKTAFLRTKLTNVGMYAKPVSQQVKNLKGVKFNA